VRESRCGHSKVLGVNRDFLSGCRALLIVHRALLSVNMACVCVSRCERSKACVCMRECV